MLILKLLLFLFSIFIPGWLAEKLWLKSRQPFLFKLALAWGLGAILITLELFCVFFLLKLKINLIIFYLFLTAESALLFYLVVRNRPNFKITNYFKNFRPKLVEVKSALSKIKIGNAVIFALIIIQIIFLAFNALTRPPIAYDNLTMWQYKPKILFYQNQINFDEQKYAYLGGGGHLNYPWQTPLLTYWLYANLGEFNDRLSNFINLIYFLSSLIIIYYFIKQHLSATVGLIAVWLFSTMPLPFYHAYNGYADLILSYYLLLAFIFLFSWLRDGGKRQLILTGMFFGCALFVKNDALIFALTGLLVILIKTLLSEKNLIYLLKRAGFYLLAIALPLLPWLFLKLRYGLNFNSIETKFGYHPEVWKNLYQTLFLNNSFNIWWFIALMSLLVNLINIKKQKELMLSWIFFALCLSGLIILYLFTDEYLFALDYTALSRNFLTLIPLSIVLAVISFVPERQRLP